MDFPNDGSTQTISSLSIVNKAENPIITSNSLSTSLASYQTLLNATCNLLGIGSAITALDYNKITLNKPSTFNPDLTNLYTKTQTDTLLNAKQANLSFTSPIVNTANTISLNESLITTLTNFYNKTNVDSLLASYYNKTSTDGRYLRLDGSNLMALNSGITLTGTGKFSGDGSLLTNVPYANITGKPTYFPVDPATSTFTNYYTTTTSDGRYLRLDAGNSMALNSGITLTGTGKFSGDGSLLTNLPYANITGKPTYFPVDPATSTFTNYYTTTTSDGRYLRLDAGNSMALNSGITLTGTGKFSGDGSLLTNIPYSVITGKPTYFPIDPATSTLTNYLTTTTAASTYLTLTGASDMSGKLTVSNGNQLSTPGIGTYGSIGTRIILWKADAVSYPYALGMNGSTMWYSVPSTAVHNFYVAGTSIMTISSSSATVVGTLGATTLSEGGTNLSSKYLLLTGGTLTGTLNGTTINASANLQEAGVNLSAKYLTSASLATTYLKLDGTNTMTGKLVVSQATPSMIRVQTNVNAIGEVSGIEFGIPDFSSGKCPKITATTEAGDASVLRFYTNAISGTTATERLTILANGNIGMGTNAPNASLELYSTTQLQPRLILSGQEFYAAYNPAFGNLQSSGIALLCGVNRTGNKQLWITDSSTLAQNSTNFCLRLTQTTIDCVATDGTTLKPINIGNTAGVFLGGKTCLGTGTAKSSTTQLTISGSSSSYTNPLVQITQTAGWDGNYALQVKGYTNIGGDGSATGLRINGEDTGNTIFQNGNNNMGLTVNNANMNFNTNGALRMYLSGSTGHMYLQNNSKLIFNDTLDDLRLQLYTGYGFGINAGTLRYTSGGNHTFYAGNTILANMRSGVTYVNGTFGVNVDATRGSIDVYASAASVVIRGTNESDTATLFFGTPYVPDSALKCALICQGMSTYSRSKLHICLNNIANNSATYNASTADYCATFNYDGDVGIGNPNPLTNGGTTTHLCIGCSSIDGSDGALVIARRIAGNRHFKTAYNSGFTVCMGDYGNENAIGTWNPQFGFAYNCPGSSLTIVPSGIVYGNFQNTSDEKIKTDISTIENALWKVQQLRGVEYTRIEENMREIGLIAQEVEYIIPEAVSENEETGLKGVNYNGLVGLLINAIKELNEKVEAQQTQINFLLNK